MQTGRSGNILGPLVQEAMSRSPSPGALSEAKRTMETKVAIIEEDPHRFKLSALKAVPPEQRFNATSPALNFERPFVGNSRLQPPSKLYQLAPIRTASMYSYTSVNSTNSENGSVQTAAPEPTSPFSITSFALSEVNTEDEDPRAGLGLGRLTPIQSLSEESLALAAAADISTVQDHTGSRSFSSSSSLVSQRSWSSAAAAADLTFGGSDDSGPSLRTPDPASVTPSQSSESVRKARSMHVLANLSCLESPLRLDQTLDSAMPRSGSSRHLKAKTVTLSSGDKGDAYKHRRHAIYGPNDRRMQLSLSYKDWNPSAIPRTPDSSQSLSSELSSGSLEPSPSVLVVERKEAACRTPQKNIPAPLLPSKSRCALDIVDPNVPSMAFLSVPPVSTAENPIFPTHDSTTPLVASLNFIKRSPNKHNISTSQQTVVRHHPIIEDLLQDLEAAISEWRILGSLINRF